MGLVRSRRRIDQDYAVPPTGRRKSSGDGGRDVHGRIDELRDRRLVIGFNNGAADEALVPFAVSAALFLLL